MIILSSYGDALTTSAHGIGRNIALPMFSRFKNHQLIPFNNEIKTIKDNVKNKINDAKEQINTLTEDFETTIGEVKNIIDNDISNIIDNIQDKITFGMWENMSQLMEIPSEPWKTISGFVGRPDLISLEFFETDKFADILTIYNHPLDPIGWPQLNETINIPDYNSLMRF